MLHRTSRVVTNLTLVLLVLAATTLTPARARTHAAPLTLTWEDYYSGCPTNAQCAALNTMIKEYEATHPGVTIKRTTVAFPDLLQKVLQQAATRTLPDVLILNNLMIPNVAESGVLADLGPYVKGWAALKDYYKSSLSTATWKGKLYGIPIGNNNLALMYNLKMLKAAGIGHPPTTWAELRADARKLTHGQVYGFGFSANASDESPWQFEPFFWANGGDLTHVADKPGVEALQLWVNLVKDGSVPKSVLTWGQTEVENQFIAGNLAMMEMGPWVLSDLVKTKDLQFGITLLPRKTASMPPASPMGGEVWTVPASTLQRQRAAWDVVRWTQDPSRIIALDTLFAYLSAYAPANRTMVEHNHLLRTFADLLPHSRFTADRFGTKYPQVSQALWKAIQDTLTGRQSVQQALQIAQSTIASLP